MTLLGLKCWISQSQRSSGNKTINLTSNFSKSPLPFILLKENGGHTLHTGCSLNIVFFRKFLNIFRTLASLSGFPQNVHRTKAKQKLLIISQELSDEEDGSENGLGSEDSIGSKIHCHCCYEQVPTYSTYVNNIPTYLFLPKPVNAIPFLSLSPLIG